MGYVITKQERVYAELAMMDKSVINVRLVITDILDVDLVHAILLEVNQTVVMKLYVDVMNSDSVNAK